MSNHLHEYKFCVDRVDRLSHSVRVTVYIDSGDISYFEELRDFLVTTGQQVLAEMENIKTFDGPNVDGMYKVSEPDRKVDW